VTARSTSARSRSRLRTARSPLSPWNPSGSSKAGRGRPEPSTRSSDGHPRHQVSPGHHRRHLGSAGPLAGAPAPVSSANQSSLADSLRSSMPWRSLVVSAAGRGPVGQPSYRPAQPYLGQGHRGIGMRDHGYESGAAPDPRVMVSARLSARKTGGIGEQVRCERVRDPAAARAASAVRGPIAGSGPQQVKVVHHQEARRQLPRRTCPRRPDGPGLRSADRRAGRMEPSRARDCHLVPGGHRVRRDEMAVPGRPLSGQRGRGAGHGYARAGPARYASTAGPARAAHGLVPARL
jgi:hypothetical protein